MESFCPTLMESVAAWCHGVRFAELMKMTGVFEVGAVLAGQKILAMGLSCYPALPRFCTQINCVLYT